MTAESLVMYYLLAEGSLEYFEEGQTRVLPGALSSEYECKTLKKDVKKILGNEWAACGEDDDDHGDAGYDDDGYDDDSYDDDSYDDDDYD